MDLEQYTRMIAAINAQLEAIADITHSQAWAGCADESNPHFEALMLQHKRLTDLSAKLTNQAAQALGIR
ncbi:MAG: hypothetical protein ACN6OP_21040 [Pseudomonadales bacterium]